VTRSSRANPVCERAAVTLHALGLRSCADASGVEVSALSGGCIHSVWRVAFDRSALDVESVVMKMADGDAARFMEIEAHGLRRLAETGTIRVPEVHGVLDDDAGAVLVMEHLQRRGGGASGVEWSAFGTALAAMHAFGGADPGTARRYGDEFDGVLGTTPQENGWCDDWVEFVRTRRLGPMLEALRQRDLLHDAEMAQMKRVIDALDRLLIADPHPARLHGDLWSGNALATGDGIAIIDPAHFVGDPLAELGIMELFGGVPDPALAAYHEVARSGVLGSMERAETRIAVFRLHHLLNHVLIFGRGYADQAMAEARRLLKG